MGTQLPRISVPALLVTLLAVALCLRLSWWQLERADEKQQWLDQQQQGSEQPALTIDQALAAEQQQHRRVKVSGRIDNQRTVLLDNRMLNGIAGYYILSPLHTDEGHWLLINRGWIGRDHDRARLPELPTLAERVSLSGTLYIPSEKTLVLKSTPLPDNQWPLRVQKVDFGAIGERLGVELAPFEIRVDPDWQSTAQETPLPRPWTLDKRMGPDHHKAYALQWFALAIAAFVVFVAASLRQARRQQNEEH